MSGGSLRPPVVAARSCLTLGASAAILFALGGWRVDYGVERELWWLRSSGYAAFTALALSLSMTPIRALATAIGRPGVARWTAPFRRALGITSAVFGLTHAAVALATYLRDSWPAVPNEPFLRAGLVALAILVALLVTSFPALVRALRIHLWKPLHRLAYVAVLFAAQHLLLAPFADRSVTWLLLGGVAAVQALRLLPSRRGAAPAERGARIETT